MALASGKRLGKMSCRGSLVLEAWVLVLVGAERIGAVSARRRRRRVVRGGRCMVVVEERE